MAAYVTLMALSDMETGHLAGSFLKLFVTFLNYIFFYYKLHVPPKYNLKNI